MKSGRKVGQQKVNGDKMILNLTCLRDTGIMRSHQNLTKQTGIQLPRAGLAKRYCKELICNSQIPHKIIDAPSSSR